MVPVNKQKGWIIKSEWHICVDNKSYEIWLSVNKVIDREGLFMLLLETVWYRISITYFKQSYILNI